MYSPLRLLTFFVQTFFSHNFNYNIIFFFGQQIISFPHYFRQKSLVLTNIKAVSEFKISKKTVCGTFRDCHTAQKSPQSFIAAGFAVFIYRAE